MVDNWDILPGAKIRRVDLHDRYGGGRQGGIAPSRQSPNVLIFSDPEVGEQHGYLDRWVGDEFHYVGEGQSGDQQMTRGNGAILRHGVEGRALRVFWGVRQTVEYAGEFELSQPEPWYTARAKATSSEQLRDVITFRLRPVGETVSGSEPGREARRLVRPHSKPLSTTYRNADESVASAPRDPFAIDPTAVDRGLIGHARTQNELALWVEASGLAPLSPGPADPDFDLAWRTADGCVVAEVKSLTNTNQDGQLRLGLGQVLDYRYQLEATGRQVQAVLAVEARPVDARWSEICADSRVTLTWPDVFEDLFTR